MDVCFHVYTGEKRVTCLHTLRSILTSMKVLLTPRLSNSQIIAGWKAFNIVCVLYERVLYYNA